MTCHKPLDVYKGANTSTICYHQIEEKRQVVQSACAKNQPISISIYIFIKLDMKIYNVFISRILNLTKNPMSLGDRPSET